MAFLGFHTREPNEWFVRSSDGVNYAVGVWIDGTYHAGTREQAEREYELLNEPGSYIWGRSERPISRTGGGSDE